MLLLRAKMMVPGSFGRRWLHRTAGGGSIYEAFRAAAHAAIKVLESTNYLF